ncbi:GNAT family N-acetyltransferase [Enterococcus sp. LJL51]|uniref:GNAT family N-acetyltransferase n=1 Tax=Enterococcus sp. LJL51 TaxID=3416656 RepID=UPI003CF89E31
MNSYFSLVIEDELCLIYPELQMAEEVFRLIDSDRTHLRQFLDFVDDVVDCKSQENYIKLKLKGAAEGTDKLFFIAMGTKIIGCIDFHFINSSDRKAEIGYWLHSSYTKMGITQKAVKTLCRYAFSMLNLNKLTIIADTENTGSNAVAEKCGFSLVGIRKQDKLIYGELRDLNEYCLLQSDYTPDC